MEYFYKGERDITQVLPIRSKIPKGEYKPYNMLTPDEKETALELTRQEIEMIDDIARERNISYCQALSRIFHDSLSLYKHVTEITNSRNK